MAIANETMQTIITALESSLDETLIESVLNRLDSFGYTVQDADTWLIGFAMQKVENTIKNECYISEIPDELNATVVDMSCGEFLFSKNQSGQLELSSLDLDGAVSSVKTGDTSVNFDTNTSDDGKLNTLISHLMNDGRGDFACFRKMQW